MRSPFRRVMVPLDGSPLSQEALGIGAGIARREAAELHLVSVVASIPPTEFVDTYAVEQDLRDELRGYLEEQADIVRRLEPGVAVTCSVVQGAVTKELARYARETAIDLIVMTTHGWSGLKRLWLGSVAQSLVHRVHCPTLLVRPGRAAGDFAPRRVLVALEHAEDADTMLESALALGGSVEGVRCTLLHVVQLQPPLLLRAVGFRRRGAQDWVGQVAEEAECRLDQVASRLRGRGIGADARVLVAHGAGEQILAVARRSKCDLIVVGTRATGLERAVLGSVADKVVRGAVQMILVVPMVVESAVEATRAQEAKALVPAPAWA